LPPVPLLYRSDQRLVAGKGVPAVVAAQRKDNLLKDAVRYVDSNLPTFLDELFELVRQPSVSATGEGIPECAGLVCRTMQQAGIEARVLDGDPYPFVYGHVGTQDRQAPTLLIYGHYDVQPPEPLDKWVTPPYAPEIRDGRIYGRGSGDNKGQFFAHLKAVEFWLRKVGSMPLGLKFLFEGGEEAGSPGLEEFAVRHRDLLQADACYAADGPQHESGRPTLFFGVRGALYLRLGLRVSRRDAHSAYAAVLPNAALELSHMLAALVDRQGYVHAPGFYSGVRPPGAREREALGRIPPVEKEVLREFGISSIAGDRSAGYYEKLMFTPVVSIEAFHAGYMGRGHKASVPSTARATLNVRLVADQDPDEIHRCLMDRLTELKGDWDLEVERMGGSPPTRTSLDHPAVQPLVEALRTAYGEDPVLLPCIGAMCHANYVMTRVLGIPMVWACYAQPDESNHAPNENLSLDHFKNGVLATVSTIDAFGRWRP